MPTPDKTIQIPVRPAVTPQLRASVDKEISQRQKLLANTTQPQTKWYRGEQPTRGETMARIYTIGQQDKAKGSQLWEAFNTFSADPTSPFYSPYRQPTSTASSELRNFGIDTTSDTWMQDYAWLKNKYRVGVNGTPLAPSNSSSAEENAAYWYYKAMGAEEDTIRAENEWAALQEEIDYWVNRSDRNYSDDEVLGKIDWSSYPTLKAMDTAAAKGVPYQLNRAVGYSQDGMYGAIWAARNGDKSGDTDANSVRYYLGQGKQWIADETSAALLDPASDQYNPYAAGSTCDEEALYFGVDSFAPDWLEQHQQLQNSLDTTAQRLYAKVYDAEQRTRAAESELTQLQADMENLLRYTSDPSVVLSGLKGQYPTLKSMDESLKSGNILPMTRAVKYRRSDLEKEVQARCDVMNSATPITDFEQHLANKLGRLQAFVESQNAITNTRSETINAAGGVIAKVGTESEKRAFQTAYVPDFEQHVSQITDTIHQGTAEPQVDHQLLVEDARDYANAHYMEALTVVRPYEALVAQRDEAQAELNQLTQAYPYLVDADEVYSAPTPEQMQVQERMEELQQFITSADQKLAWTRPEYNAAMNKITQVETGYATADRYAALSGVAPAAGYSDLQLMDFAYALGADYKPTDWQAYSLYDMALQEGHSRGEVSAAAARGREENQKMVDQIDQMLLEVDTRGIWLPTAIEQNMRRERDRLVRDIKAADYFMLADTEDFEAVVAETKQKVGDAWANAGWFPDLFKPGGYDRLSYYAVAPEASINMGNGRVDTFMWQATQEERDTYLYLLGTQGEDAAREYYDYLADATYGVLPTRTAEHVTQFWSDFAAEHEITATALSVISSPFQLAGTLYAVGAGLTGQEINPNNPAFGASSMISTTRSTVKKEIDGALGEGTPGAQIANFAYDVITGVGDSAMNVMLTGGAGVGTMAANASSRAGKLALKLADSFLHAAPMGAAAAGSAIQQAKQNKAEDWQALAMGGATFLAETATEAITVGNISDAFNAGPQPAKKFLATLATDMFEEGAGEGLSEALTTVSDDLIMGELSQRNQQILNYMDDGLSREDAEKRANADVITNVLYAVAVGSVSGGVTTTVSTTMGKAVDSFEKHKRVKQLGHRLTTLAEAANSQDEANITAAIAAVLSPENVTPQEQSALSATAQHLTARMGKQSAEVIRDILVLAAEANVSVEDVSYAITVAMLGGGIANSSLENLRYERTADGLKRLMTAVSIDLQHDWTLENIDKAVAESQVAMRVKDLAADGALAGLNSYQVSAAQALAALRTAQENLETAQQDYQGAGEHLQTVQEQFSADPANPTFMGAHQQAIKDAEGKAIVVAQYMQSVQNAEQKLQEAEDTLAQQQESAMVKLREQAQQDVLAEQEAAAQAQVEAEAQAAAAAQQAYDDAVQLYKPSVPGNNEVLTLTNGESVQAVGYVGVDKHGLLTLTPDGTILSANDLTDESMQSIISNNMLQHPDVWQGLQQLHHTAFDKVVEMMNPTTGELHQVVGSVGTMNGEWMLLTTDNQVMQHGTELVETSPEAVATVLPVYKTLEQAPEIVIDDMGLAVKASNLASATAQTQTQAQSPTQTQTTQPPQTGAPTSNQPAMQLEPWQDPQYHGKVKAARKLRTDTKSFANWFNDPSGDLTDPVTGKPRLFYRGFGHYGNHLYIEHASKPDADGHTYNFYMDTISTAESYAGTNKIITLYDIVNWETAAKAMESIGLELRPGVINTANLNGDIGYQLYKASGFPVNNGWFAENELDKFRATYGGKPEAEGIFAGYISVKKPLVIDAQNHNYSGVTATVTDNNGVPYTASQSTRKWAQWAFKHGYDSLIVRNVSDNASGHGGDFGTEVVTSKGSMFKSIYNTGKLGKKNNNILYNKGGVFALTGEAVSKPMKATLDTLALGNMVTPEELDSIPEVQWAKEHMLQGDSVPYKKGGYTDAEMRALVGDERYQLQLDIADELMSQGSAVIDKNGKTTYTGAVKQEKRLDIIIGPPAAGKSSALADPISQAFGSRILDSDAVKERLPEYEGGLNSGYVHTESRHVWKQMQAEAITDGDNVVLPVVGRSEKSVREDIARFKQAGYSVNLHYLELEGTKTLGRALNRFLSDGRYIDPAYIMSVSDGGIATVYDTLKGEDQIDEYSRWSNDVPRGEPPRFLEGSNSEFAGALHARGTDVGRELQQVAGGSEGPQGAPWSGETSSGQQVTQTKQYAKGSTQQTQQGASSMPSGKPKKSPQAIAKGLAQKLHTGDYIGTRKMNGVPREVLGYYETRANYIAVRNTEAGNYSVAMHEIGHAVAQKLGMTGTQDMIGKLDPVFAASYSASELPGEAFAEFMWRYMASEQAGRDFAGDAFVDTFETELARKGLAQDVKQAATELRMWVAASTDAKIGAVIHPLSEAKKTPLRDQFRKLIASVVDSTAAAEAVNHKIRELSGDNKVPLSVDVRSASLMKNTASKRAYNILTKNLTDANWNVIGDGLAQVLEKSGITAENMDLLEQYMLALHSLDRDAQGKPVFDTHITAVERQTFINKVQTEHPEVARAEEAFQKWRHNFLTEFLVKPGYLSQSAFDQMEQMYPHYVPTRRVKDSRYQMPKGSKQFQVRQATGSTEDIWSPIDTFVTMVDSIVTMVSANNAALTWERAAAQYELGEFGRQITPDTKLVTVNTEPLQEKLKDLLEGNLDNDLLSEAIDLIGMRQQQWVTTNNSSLPNTLVVQHPDGSVGLWEIRDTELYKLLASVSDKTGNRVIDTIGKLTRGMTALTTGSNPVFAFRNAARDFQNSVNTGTWATSYADGFVKWAKAAYHVWTKSDAYQDYLALGGGGWSRIDAGTKKGAAQYRSELFKGYNTSNIGRTAKFVGRKLWETVTLARLNEVVEQTSRVVEYLYGKHDLSTPEGKMEAFLAGQDVTTDFNRSGNGNLAYLLKQIIPFFNASVQGVYRTGRRFTEAERKNLPQVFAKTFVNTGLVSALVTGLLLKTLDEDEKEEFAQMSDELKAQHIYLPNFAPGIFGQQPFIRIPLAQDPLTYAVHGAVTNAIWAGSSDDAVIELTAIAETILDSLNPVGSGTIFQPIIGIGQNRNWYGGRIIPTRVSQNQPYASLQYTEDTPELFVAAGRLFNTSPMAIQYLAEQYTGFLGQLAIPALSPNAHTGELGGLNAAINAARKRFTSDPLISQDIVGSFYDGASALGGIVQAGKDGMPMNMLRRGLTPEEAGQAYEEAKEMTSSNGIVGQTKKTISALYDEIDAVNANQTLTDEQKYQLTSELRREIAQQSLIANEAIGAYNEKYMYGDNLLARTFTAGTVARIPTTYEKLPEVFLQDADAPYMVAAREMWETTGNDSMLPHPRMTFTSEKVEYEVAQEQADRYAIVYQLGYQKYFDQNSEQWDSLTDEERANLMTKAHEKAHDAAKKWYLRQLESGPARKPAKTRN